MDFDHQPTERLRLLDAYRDMRGYDHELAFSLSLVEFSYKPLITRVVKRAMCITVKFDIVLSLGIVQRNNLDWYALGLRFEAVTRKVVVDIVTGEARLQRGLSR